MCAFLLHTIVRLFSKSAVLFRIIDIEAHLKSKYMEKNNKIETKSEYSWMKCLTLEEQRNLIERVKQGSQEAEEELKNVYIRLVSNIAKQYLNKGVSEEELLKAGTEGLVKAAHNYDTSYRFKFIAYAVWWIRRSILSAIRDVEKL